MLNESLIINENIVSVKKEEEYLICTKNKNGDCIILSSKTFRRSLDALYEARKMLSLIVAGNALESQTKETRAYIAQNMYIGKRIKIINTSQIESVEKV
jgi:hypothetical protein